MTADDLPEIGLYAAPVVIGAGPDAQVKYAGFAGSAALDPWLVTFEARDVGNRLVVTKLTIELDPESAPSDPETGELSYPSRGIGADVVSAVRVGSILRALRRKIVADAAGFEFEPDTIQGRIERAMAALQSPERAALQTEARRLMQQTLDTTSPPKLGRRRLSDEHLRAVAEARLRLQNEGVRGVNAEIASLFGLNTAATAKEHVVKATAAGWLAPGEQGDPAQSRRPGPALLNAWAHERSVTESKDRKTDDQV